MTNHVLRPLIAFAGIVVAIVGVRTLLVPADFGIGPSGYMYGWHRAGNEAEWKALTPKYKGSQYCQTCHTDKYSAIKKSPHTIIQCENCHGPARDHPNDPPKLEVNRDRSLCIRCHAAQHVKFAARAKIKSIDPAKHNPGLPCAGCHNPHTTQFGGS